MMSGSADTGKKRVRQVAGSSCGKRSRSSRSFLHLVVKTFFGAKNKTRPRFHITLVVYRTSR